MSSDLLFHDRQGDLDDQYMEDLDMEGGEYDYLNDLEEPSDHEVWECQQGTARWHGQIILGFIEEYKEWI